MKHQPHLILTIDYEIFGDGSGDICHCVTQPAMEMLTIADKYQAPLTFFVEVLEFMALENEKATNNDSLKVRQQLIELIQHQHDVQLHLHPQWVNPEYLQNNQWSLDFKRWRIGDLNQKEVSELFKIGKCWLEEMLQPVNENYHCHTFRAGGWCIQPSGPIINAMVENEFLMESTVAPGVKNSTPGEWSDFRKTPNDSSWRTSQNVCEANSDGIWEVPILTGKVSRMRHLNAIKSAKNQPGGGMAAGCIGSYRGPDSKFQSALGKFEKLLRLGRVMLDFSTMPADILIDISQQWLDKHEKNQKPTPLVAIAHTKNFTPASAQALDAYLQWATDNNINLSTYGQWLKATEQA